MMSTSIPDSLKYFFRDNAERFRVRVAVLGTPVYTKFPADFNFLRKTAIDEMEDFRLFGLQWQADVVRKNLEVLKHA